MLAVAVHGRLDERAAEKLGVGRALAQAVEQAGALLAGVTEQDGGAKGGCERSVLAGEQRRERLPARVVTLGSVLEERELPPVDRLAELGVVLGERKPLAQIAGKARTELVQARRLACRMHRRVGLCRPGSARPVIEAVEDERPGSHRRARCEPKEMADVSLVLAPYGNPLRAVGVVGVLGPTRMAYPQAIGTVRFVSGLMNELIDHLYA